MEKMDGKQTTHANLLKLHAVYDYNLISFYFSLMIDEASEREKETERKDAISSLIKLVRNRYCYKFRFLFFNQHSFPTSK